jgi:protein O-GlcNAc transferase
MADSIDARAASRQPSTESEAALVTTIGKWLAEQRQDEAAARLEAALDEHPEWPMAHALMAVTEVRRGRLDAAAAAFDRAVTLDAANATVQLERASFLARRGRHAEAIDAIEATIGRVPENAAAHHLRVTTLAAAGEVARAFRAMDDALAALPGSLDLLCLKGALQRADDQLREALATQRLVLARAPDHLPALIEAGATLQRLGRAAEAIDHLDRALEQNGDQVAALVAMGMAESDLQMDEAAFAALDRAAQLAPNDPDIALKRGMMLQRLNRLEEAITTFKRTIELHPTNFSAHINIGACYSLRGRYGEALDWFDKARALEPTSPMPYSNKLFTLLHDPSIELADLAQAHRDFGERFGNPEGRYHDWPNDLDPERKLRIGIVSAEFCGNAGNALVLPFIEGIDRTSFALFGFSNNPIRDPVTKRFERLFDDLQSIVGLDDRAAAEDIRAKEIDILIDFTGHTGMNRLTCFALKPAPVQAGWIGYPFTTGLRAIDYSIMDSVAVRPGEEVHFVETVVRLEGTRFCVEPPAIALPVSQPPALSRGWITFGSFNRLNKITDDVLRVWYRILQAVPGSRLMLKDSALVDGSGEVDRLHRLLAECGLERDRLELRGRSDYATFLREHAEMDIALDPFPFSGAGTSVDALWMGLPIVTLPGKQPVSRQAETFLTALGRRDWVAADIDDYIRIATKLAADPLRLADLRRTQRDDMLHSRLCDKHLAARDIERAWRWMWRRYVASRTSA